MTQLKSKNEIAFCYQHFTGSQRASYSPHTALTVTRLHPGRTQQGPPDLHTALLGMDTLRAFVEGTVGLLYHQRVVMCLGSFTTDISLSKV